MEIELKGVKGFAAYQVYVSIVAFLPTCAKYNAKEFSTEDNKADLDAIFEDFKSLDDESKKRLLLECLQVDMLADHQIVALLGLHKDKNGKPISARTVNSIEMHEIMKMILNTCVACSQINSELFF